MVGRMDEKWVRGVESGEKGSKVVILGLA